MHTHPSWWDALLLCGMSEVHMSEIYVYICMSCDVLHVPWCVACPLICCMYVPCPLMWCMRILSMRCTAARPFLSDPLFFRLVPLFSSSVLQSVQSVAVCCSVLQCVDLHVMHSSTYIHIQASFLSSRSSRFTLSVQSVKAGKQARSGNTPKQPGSRNTPEQARSPNTPRHPAQQSCPQVSLLW